MPLQRDGTLLVDGSNLVSTAGRALGGKRLDRHPSLRDGHGQHGADAYRASPPSVNEGLIGAAPLAR